MPVSTVVKNFRDGTIQLKDGTGTPVTLTASIEEGNLKLSGLTHTSKSYERSIYEDRGEFATVRKTKRKYPQVSFSVHLTDISDATAGTIIDFFLKQGQYSTNVSTLGSTTGLEYAINIILTVEGTDLGDATDHSITMSDVICDDCSIEEGDPDTVNFSGRVLDTVDMA